MTRDVGLDIIVAKMVAHEYMGAIADAEVAMEIDAYEQRGIIVKGLLRNYANAVQNDDLELIDRTRAALDEVAVSKALEIFNLASGQQQREVIRDSKGRFSRYLDSAPPTTQAVGVYREGQRDKRDVGVQRQALKDTIESNQTTSVPDPGQANYQAALEQRKLGMMQAGKVRAIARFQDELMDVFGTDNQDIVVIVENTPTSSDVSPEAAEVPLKSGVTDEALAIAQEPGARMSIAMRPGAKAGSREKFQTLNALMEAGMRPDMAAAYLQEPKKGKNGEMILPANAHSDIVQALNSYTGRKESTYKKKAQRHLKTAETLGSYFTSSGQPQLQALGGALTAAGKLGGVIDDRTYEFAERMNYRLRGMKDNLPREFTEMIRTKDYATLSGAFNDPGLTPQKWHGEVLPKIMGRVREERALSTNERTRTVSFSNATDAVLSHMDLNVSRKVSPRDFVDRFTRDVAITSLIREVPADDRIVQLGAAAGFGIPSSGIIIRSDGQAKEMYRGISDDHYLPFSAKALPELRDGQYVRTRVLGGLTPEDITTSVVSGARKAAVVSGSGVFTIELRPDTSLTGRLASPEVAAMGERYERILNQVAGSGLYARDLPPEEKAKIYDQARQFAGNVDSKEFQDRRKSLTKAKRAEMSTLTEKDISDIKEKVIAEAEGANIGGRSAQQRAQIVDDLVKDEIQNARDERVRALSLNAEGYALALETLKAQYPAIIRSVGHESLTDFVNAREMTGVFERGEVSVRNRRGKTDTGLVEPGQTNAYVKDWTKGEARKPGAAAATAAAAAKETATTAATGTAAPAAATGTSLQLLRTTQLKRQIDKAISDTSAVNPFRNKLPVDTTKGAVGEKAVYETPADFQAALPPASSGTGAETGIDVPITSGKYVGAIVTNDRMMEKAVQSQDGLTVVMSLAFGQQDVGDTGWAGYFADDANGKDPGIELKEDLAAEVNRQASAYLLRHSEPLSGPLPTSNHLGFYTPKDVLEAVPKTIEDGKGKEAQDRIRMMSYDTAVGGTPSAYRKKAKDLVDNWVRNDNDLLRFNQTMDLEPGSAVEQLSVLGLMGLQAKLMKDIDGIQFSEANGTEAQALLHPLDNNIAQDSASFDEKKKAIKEKYQGMFGTEFALRLMGGGVGPKALSPQVEVLHKSVEEEQLELLSRLVLDNPERAPDQQPQQPLHKGPKALHLTRS